MRNPVAVALFAAMAGVSPEQVRLIFDESKTPPEPVEPSEPIPYHLLGKKKRIARNYSRRAREGLGEIPGRLEWARK